MQKDPTSPNPSDTDLSSRSVELSHSLSQILKEPSQLSDTEKVLHSLLDGPPIEGPRFGLSLDERAGRLRILASKAVRAEASTTANEIIVPGDLALDTLAPELGIVVMHLSELQKTDDAPILDVLRIIDKLKNSSEPIDPLKVAFIEGVRDGFIEEMIRENERALEHDPERTSQISRGVVYECMDWLKNFPGIGEINIEGLELSSDPVVNAATMKVLVRIASDKGLGMELIRVAEDFIYCYNSFGVIKVKGEEVFIMLRDTPLPECGGIDEIYAHHDRRAMWGKDCKLIIPGNLQFTRGEENMSFWDIYDINMRGIRLKDHLGPYVSTKSINRFSKYEKYASPDYQTPEVNKRDARVLSLGLD